MPPFYFRRKKSNQRNDETNVAASLLSIALVRTSTGIAREPPSYGAKTATCGLWILIGSRTAYGMTVEGARKTGQRDHIFARLSGEPIIGRCHGPQTALSRIDCQGHRKPKSLLVKPVSTRTQYPLARLRFAR
jgi:hypothetical protein